MKLQVEHLTQFEYDPAVYETATEVRLRPLSNHGSPQQCESFALQVDPATQVFTYTDYFGNEVSYFNVLQPHNRLSITTSAIVETGPGTSPITEQELGNLYDYQARSRYIVFGPSAVEFTARFSQAQAITDPRGLAETVCRTINSEFVYEKGVTDVNSTVAEVLELKRGVCQDFAHLMITTCRMLALPTRYVSGYVYTGSGDLGEVAEGASHAWCEVYIGEAQSWIGFDPTHQSIYVNDKYIKIGAGRDYADIPPVRGTYKGRARESLSVNVRVGRVE